MDLALLDHSRTLTPAKQKAEFSAAANEDDNLWKKLKAEESSAAIEDDLLSAVKFVSSMGVEESPEDQYSPEDLQSPEDEDSPENLESPEDEKPPAAIKSSAEEGWVDEEPEVPDPNRYTVLKIDYDEEDYDFANEEEKKNFELYYEEFAKSDGFDIEHFSNKAMDSVVPMNMDEEDKYLVTRDCRKSIVAAIKYKNLVYGWNLELVKLIKCNIVTGASTMQPLMLKTMLLK